ncbi:hypothetical protein KUD11_07410 [Roseovarius sp. LXJ103]|uniref:hypothetical protein n=1 Tax=Roseovarius carneus TaxID=2853164 RepID=UPI000D61BBAD|nr:hypothetical protein [Roseovarius carneus]MBZ8118475.1 hypothetical protein [Roseovarius carneus]PWE35827.1 hypothetical protein DD563_07565 [Pelagicola sp. LXJ1103]
MIHIRSFRRVAGVAVASVLLAGCAADTPQPARSGAAAQGAVPQAAPSATRPKQAERIPLAAPVTLAVSATYLERIMIPIGSELTLRAETVSGMPAITRIKTMSGPPYDISVSIPSGAEAYPMTVTATLNATIGHVLSGSVVLDAVPGGAVEIVMRTQAQ